MEDNAKNMIYGGTGENILDQILNWLLTEPDRIAIFKLVHIYIYCYKKYYTPAQLLQIIINLWNKEPPTEDDTQFVSKNRSAIVLFLSGWFESQCYIFGKENQIDEDFNGDVGENLQNFINSLPTEYQKPLLAKFENAKKPCEPTIILFKPSKSKIKIRPNKLFNILHIKPSRIAEEWTLMDIKGMLSIRKSEFLNPGSNWDKMLKRSAMFTRWVASEIVEKSTVSKRVKAYKRFIKMGVRFLELKNFNGLMCLWGGLNTISVDRLKKTKKKLPKQYFDIIKAFENQLSEENNFRKLRTAMSKYLSSHQPVMPWFELISKMRNWMTNYEDYLVNDTNEKIWNFGKMYVLGSQIITFDKYQNINRNVDLQLDDNDSNIAIRTFLEHLPTYPDEMLFKFSEFCEKNKTVST